MNKNMTFTAVFLAAALMGTGCVTDGYYGHATTAYPAETYTTGAGYMTPTYVEPAAPITYIETVQPVGYVETRYVAPPPRHHRGPHRQPHHAHSAPPPRTVGNGGPAIRPTGSRPHQARPAPRASGAPVRKPTRPAAKPSAPRPNQTRHAAKPSGNRPRQTRPAAKPNGNRPNQARPTVKTGGVRRALP